MPRKMTEITLKDHVDKLTQLFGSNKSKFSLRFECLNVAKKADDDFYTYAGIVNRITEDFDFDNLTKKEFKSLIFILGLRDHKDTELRLRLLSLLDKNKADPTNLIKKKSLLQLNSNPNLRMK